MKKNQIFKFLTLILFVSVLTACSKDDDGGSDDLLSQVPSGEIVPVDQRDEVLVGYSTNKSQQKAADAQKWWKHEVTQITYDCADYDESDNETISLENTYFAFKENGGVYFKQGLDGSETYVYDWEWESSAKEAIIAQGVSFKFRELNENTITYASVQGQANCKALTWEKFNK